MRTREKCERCRNLIEGQMARWFYNKTYHASCLHEKIRDEVLSARHGGERNCQGRVYYKDDLGQGIHEQYSGLACSICDFVEYWEGPRRKPKSCSPIKIGAKHEDIHKRMDKISSEAKKDGSTYRLVCAVCGQVYSSNPNEKEGKSDVGR